MIHGHSRFHAMVVSHLSDLASIPDGSEKTQSFQATPRRLSGTCAKGSAVYPSTNFAAITSAATFTVRLVNVTA